MTENYSELINRPEVISVLEDECIRRFLIRKDDGLLHIFTDIFSELTHEDLARKHLNTVKQNVIGGYIKYVDGQISYARASSTVPVASESEMFKAWQYGVELHD